MPLAVIDRVWLTNIQHENPNLIYLKLLLSRLCTLTTRGAYLDEFAIVSSSIWHHSLHHLKQFHPSNTLLSFDSESRRRQPAWWIWGDTRWTSRTALWKLRVVSFKPHISRPVEEIRRASVLFHPLKILNGAGVLVKMFSPSSSCGKSNCTRCWIAFTLLSSRISLRLLAPPLSGTSHRDYQAVISVVEHIND